MSILEIIIVSIGICFESLAVTIYKGANQAALKNQNNILVGLIFGGIQVAMLTIGMLIIRFPLSAIYTNNLLSFNQWISAIIFIYLGVKMFKSAIKGKAVNEHREAFSYRIFASLAFATSIDALILGIGIALLGAKLLAGMLIVFLITSILSMTGLRIGYWLGDRYRTIVNLSGGVILLIMGIKTILTYFQVI